MVGTSSYVFIRESLLKYHIFPQWNSYIGTGIPLASDPLNNFLNPFISLIFISLPFILAVKTFLLLSVLFSGIASYLLLKYFRIEKIFALLSSIVYMCSGFLIARIDAGHFEWIAAYPLIPLFFYLVFKTIDKKNILYSGLLAIVLTLFFFSGNLYAVFYGFLSIIALILFLGIKFLATRKKIFATSILYLLFSCVMLPFFSFAKLLPVAEFSSEILRGFNPYLGSQNIPSVLFNLFLPAQDLFKFLSLDKYLISSYFWWESFAYIGPLFLLGILAFFYNRRKIKLDLNPVIFLLIVFLLYSFLGSLYSPFYWLVKYIPPLQAFRIPSRIFMFVIPLIIVVGNVGLASLWQKRYLLKLAILILLVLNLLSVYSVFKSFYYTRNFPPINKNFYSLLNFLKINDKSHYYIAENINFENQLPLYQSINNHQKIFDPNGGWGVKDNPAGKYVLAEVISNYVDNDVRPKYFIYPSNYSPPKIFNAKVIKEENGAKLYEGSRYTPYAYVTEKINQIPLVTEDDKNIKKITIGINKIEIIAYSPDNNHFLTLLEANFSNWGLSLDGIKKNILKNRFLVTKMEKGIHSYSYYYFSYEFILGLFISVASILSWLFIIGLRFFKQLK